MKLNYKFLLIVTGLITVANANCTKDEIAKLTSKDFSKKEIKSICGDIKHSGIKLQWLNLSKETCLENGGEIHSNVCIANWSNANKICSVAGGRLVSRLELKESILKCGGMVNEYSHNIKSSSYQTCCEKDGFSAVYDYWSSTSCRTNKQDAWVAYIGSGDVYKYNKDGKSYVKCVKDEQ